MTLRIEVVSDVQYLSVFNNNTKLIHMVTFGYYIFLYITGIDVCVVLVFVILYSF
jgi:hypothetical protein